MCDLTAGRFATADSAGRGPWTILLLRRAGAPADQSKESVVQAGQRFQGRQDSPRDRDNCGEPRTVEWRFHSRDQKLLSVTLPPKNPAPPPICPCLPARP